MPSKAEFDELIANCSAVWSEVNGKRGYWFVSNINNRRIFMPAPGVLDGTSRSNYGSLGRYWATNYKTETLAYDLGFTNSNIVTESTKERWVGLSIRPVYDPNL